MAHDLRRRVLKQNMTRKQFLALPGKPDNLYSDSSNAKDALLTYDLGSWSGFGLDPDIFEGEFDKSGRLTKSHWSQT